MRAEERGVWRRWSDCGRLIVRWVCLDAAKSLTYSCMYAECCRMKTWGKQRKTLLELIPACSWKQQHIEWSGGEKEEQGHYPFYCFISPLVRVMRINPLTALNSSSLRVSAAMMSAISSSVTGAPGAAQEEEREMATMKLHEVLTLREPRDRPKCTIPAEKGDTYSSFLNEAPVFSSVMYSASPPFLFHGRELVRYHPRPRAAEDQRSPSSCTPTAHPSWSRLYRHS
jgi:hypothetical protein